MRSRKFTPENFFLSVLHLVSSTNSEGFVHALVRTWHKCQLPQTQAPAKSSFCEFRLKVSYKFFEDLYRNDLQTTSRQKFRGFYLYAADGDQLDVMPSESLLQSGFRGTPCPGKKLETYCLKMYTVQTYDVINGLVRDFRFSAENSETQLARGIIPALEKKSITIYDRLHCGYPTISAHLAHGSSFLMRARCGGKGSNLQRDVRKFRNSKDSSRWVNWRPQGSLYGQPSVRVRLVKIKHPKTKEIYIFVTNLNDNAFSDDEISQLYLRRWDIEGSFRDLTSTLKMEQWHSKNLNGILQEIYALLWLFNKIRASCFDVCKAKRDWFVQRVYRKCNFKLALNLFIDHLDLLVQRQEQQFNAVWSYWITKTTEKRRRFARNYPRVVKRRGRFYETDNTVSLRA